MSETAQIKNEFGEDRIVPWLGDRLVVDGQVVDVPVEDVWAYTCQDGWTPVDSVAQEIHDAKLAELAEPEAPEEPAGNAARETWAAYVLAAGLAVESDLSDDQGVPLGRDQIRDKYRTQEG